MPNIIKLQTPIKINNIQQLRVGDVISISGYILAGRDAALPKLVKLIHQNKLKESGIDLEGSVIFHTAVSPAGVGPTSSNKIEIEESFIPLSKAGTRIHLGKGKISSDTVKGLKDLNAVFAIIPPITALLGELTYEKKVLAFPELGMEALYILKVKDYQAIIAAAGGESIYDRH